MSAATIETHIAEIKDQIDDLASRVTVSDESMAHLNHLYGLIWIESNYDPRNESTQKFAEKLLPHIKALNAELKFKK
jgi:hypothetical protein